MLTWETWLCGIALDADANTIDGSGAGMYGQRRLLVFRAGNLSLTSWQAVQKPKRSDVSLSFSASNGV